MDNFAREEGVASSGEECERPLTQDFTVARSRPAWRWAVSATIFMAALVLAGVALTRHGHSAWTASEPSEPPAAMMEGDGLVQAIEVAPSTVVDVPAIPPAEKPDTKAEKAAEAPAAAEEKPPPPAAAEGAPKDAAPPPEAAAPKDAAAADAAAKKPPPAAKGAGIPPCNDEEADGCPTEWKAGETGGFYCKQGGGCQEWALGPFPKEACPDQCSIGTIPTTTTSTSTSSTSTSTTLTKTTITTTTKAYLSPSLLCYSVARSGGEMDIMKFQMKHECGIFACDETMVLSDGVVNLGEELGKNFPTTLIPPITGGVSKDGTSANTEVFLQAWRTVGDDPRRPNLDWIVKADPDAVLLPDRLRLHVQIQNHKTTYVKNCNKYDGPDWPLMFGALEAISQGALQIYLDNEERCKNELEWSAWGEDYFLSHCLDHLGVEAVGDFNEIGDNLCNGAWCGEGAKAAFHPFKSLGDWKNCWLEATGQLKKPDTAKAL